MGNAKRITLTTVKSFIVKSGFYNVDREKNKLWLKVKAEYNSQVDGVEQINSNFQMAQWTGKDYNNALGIKDAWFVLHSSDYFTYYEQDGFKGIHVSNCCGAFILAVKENIPSINKLLTNG